MDLYQLSVVVSYCLLSEGLFKGIEYFFNYLEKSLSQLIMKQTIDELKYFWSLLPFLFPGTACVHRNEPSRADPLDLTCDLCL